MFVDRARIEHLLRERFGSFGALRYRSQVRVYHLKLAALRWLDRALGRRSMTFGTPLSANRDPQAVSNYTRYYPAENVLLGDPGQDSFLNVCQFVQNGRLYRPEVFVCEVHEAKFFPKIGLVFNAEWRPIVESILDRERLHNFKQYLRPRKVTRRRGVFSSVCHLWHFNNWHWMADCLPQVRSLDRYMQGRPLTLLMPSELGMAERESLACILPANFTLEYVPADEWFEVENFILPSHVSSRANAFLPREYYEFIQTNTLSSLGITRPARATGRYYISRARAKHRRILNEPALVTLLEEFGFISVLMEEFSFHEQVEFFVNAEAIVSPHSAALGSIMYGDHLKLCIFYPEARPATYFYTLARGLGQEHFYLTGNSGEHDDFSVDLVAVRNILTTGMCLDRRNAFESQPRAIVEADLIPASAPV